MIIPTGLRSNISLPASLATFASLTVSLTKQSTRYGSWLGIGKPLYVASLAPTYAIHAFAATIGKYGKAKRDASSIWIGINSYDLKRDHLNYAFFSLATIGSTNGFVTIPRLNSSY